MAHQYHPQQPQHHRQLPSSQYPPARLARARNAPTKPAPLTLPVTQSLPQVPFPPPQAMVRLDSPIDLSSPSLSPTRKNKRGPKRSLSSSFSHSSSSLQGLGGEMDLMLDFTDLGLYSSSSPGSTPPLTPALSASPSPSLFSYHASSVPQTPSPTSHFATVGPHSPIRPSHTHIRSPSLPSFDMGRYANSNFQNSPPPRELPKPKFLSGSSSFMGRASSSNSSSDPFLSD
jgi:hypothetical protein